MRSTASSSIIAAAEASRGTGLRPVPAYGDSSAVLSQKHRRYARLPAPANGERSS